MGESKKLLGKRTVEAIQPGSVIWDTRVTGFGARRQRSEAISYVLSFRDAAKKQRWFTIGRHGPLWTPETARARAVELLGELSKGVDIKKQKPAADPGLTVADLCRVYLEAADAGALLGKRGVLKKASTIVSDRSRIKINILPLLGTKRLSDLTRADVNQFVSDVTTGKAREVQTTLRGRTAIKGGPGAATRTTGLLGSMLRWAVDHGHLTTNPAAGVRRPAGKKRTQRLTADQYGQLGAVLLKHGLNDVAVQAVVLIATTGCRVSEITGLRWSELDSENRRLVLGDSKTGMSVRPLGNAPFQFLCRIHRDPDSGFVFPAPRKEGGPHQGLRAMVNRLYDEANVPGLRSHILRHGFGSVAANCGFGREITGELLGHAVSSITQGYMHYDPKVITKAADVVSDKIVEQMDIEGMIFL